MYKYFISFAYSDGEKNGFGNGEFYIKEPVTNLATIEELEEKISKSKRLEDVRILNYILLKKFGE